MRDHTKSIVEQIAVDEGNGIITIFGQKFAAELLESLSEPTPAGRWFRVTSTDGFVITVHVRTDLIEPVP